MAKYLVIVSCMVYASKEIEVEAPDDNAAWKKALSAARKVRDWDVDTDQTDGDYQVVDVEECE